MEYQVKIDAFEGPLDLLLHLVNRLEIDIYNISVSQITDQYIAFIHEMQELQLDVAGDYLVMAATLLQMKSKMLLPRPEEVFDEDEYADAMLEDPREELIRRLVEYKKYKIVSEKLAERESRWQQVYAKAPVPLGEPKKVRPLADSSVYNMLSALQKLVRRKMLTVPRNTKIHRQEISIQDRMDEIMKMLIHRRRKTTFYDLYVKAGPEREQVVTTFLAVLELMKKRMVTCEQEGNFANILIHPMQEEA